MTGPQTVTALSLLSMDPSPAVAASAQQAARTKHGLVNVTRLVRALERIDHEDDDMSWLEVQKTWETVLYARALLQALRGSNEQSSTTASTIDDLERILGRVEVQVQDAARHVSAPAPPSSLPYIQLPTPPEEAAAEDLLEAHVPTKLELEPTELDIPVIEPSPAPAPAPVTPAAASEAFDMSSYFAKREREAQAGGEAGLLPIKPQEKPKDVMDEEGMRQRLLGGQQKGMGARELQEELSGQLAGMSHQLKLNAMQFSQSLEDEKALLQSSQDVLEQNLDGTLKSKGNLDQVSRKGRSTTCMQLGIMITVLLLFVWTYMLIKFT